MLKHKKIHQTLSVMRILKYSGTLTKRMLFFYIVTHQVLYYYFFILSWTQDNSFRMRKAIKEFPYHCQLLEKP